MSNVTENHYKCQNCTDELRKQCIDRTALPVAVKQALYEAFMTDTVSQQLTQLIQVHCLLEEESQPLPKRKGLQDRITPRTIKIEGLEATETAAPSPSPIPSKAAAEAPNAQNIGPATAKGAELPRPASAAAAPALILKAQSTGHRIALPVAGQLTLGGWCDFTSAPPDVDLTFDDRAYHSLAQRHARVTGHAGHYTIERVDNFEEVWLNQNALEPGQPSLLQAGDTVQLGSCVLDVAPAPESWTTPHPPYVLYTTTTRQVFPLVCQDDTLLIGRVDLLNNFLPDIDLSGEGLAALVVSRRHAALRCQEGGFEITDLSSSNGTKVDGVLLKQGEWAPLRPGQHLCLGGFGLTLEVESYFVEASHCVYQRNGDLIQAPEAAMDVDGRPESTSVDRKYPAKNITVKAKGDVLTARQEARDLARATGFNSTEQAYISLAIATLANSLGLGPTYSGNITLSYAQPSQPAGLQVVCRVSCDLAGAQHLNSKTLTKLHSMMDEVQVTALSPGNVQVTLTKIPIGLGA